MIGYNSLRRRLARYMGEGPRAGEARAARGAGAPPEIGARRMLFNALSLIAGKVATMGLGFVAWLLAARLFAPAEVGLASGVLAAMMLCTQLALLGVSSAVISLFPQHQRRPEHLLDSAISIVAAAALLAGGAFLLLSGGLFGELSVVAATPFYSALFLSMSVLGTVGILFDQVSAAQRRGAQMMARVVVAGVLTIAALVAMARLGDGGSVAIFSAWVVGGSAAFLLGTAQLWRSLSGYLYRPRVELKLARPLFQVGLPNYGLTLAERAPALLMPVLVTELLSPETNAYWYAIWMMAWVVLVVPVQVGINLFAEASHRPQDLGAVIRHSMRTSLALGLLGAAGVIVLAELLLALLGQSYAAAGALPLRILVLTAIPYAFIQAYFAASRARRRLGEALLTGILGGGVAVAAAIAAGLSFGLTGMTVAWLAAQLLTGTWAAWRLRSLLRPVPAGGESAGDGVAAVTNRQAAL